jgi:motility quorum-sensing regulator/GCU-specific mRNA interferase toxin
MRFIDGNALHGLGIGWVDAQLLASVKALVLERGLSAFTRTALDNAWLMGLDPASALVVVLGLQRGMLFKSMTTHTDRRVWQDVYHAPCPNGRTAYIKVTIQAGATVIQFKEK